jgi:hypothetical protein
VKRIDGSLLMCHKHLSRAMVSASLPAGPIDRIPEGVRNVGDLSAGDREHAIVQLDVHSIGGAAQALSRLIEVIGRRAGPPFAAAPPWH